MSSGPGTRLASRPSIDPTDRRVRELVGGATARVYGIPASIGHELVTHCAGCGVNADDVGVDPHTELCDKCIGVGA